MPDLGQRKKLDLSSQRKKQASGSKEPPSSSAKKSPAPTSKKPSTKPARTLLDDDDEDDLDPMDDGEDDEIIGDSIRQRNEGKGLDIKLVIGCVAVVIVVVIGFIFFMSSRNKDDEGDVVDTPPTEQEEPAPEGPVIDDPSVGTQDFTQDTNNKSDSPMTNPDDFTKDIYGLTTRVDYDVAAIQSAADFVNYTKHRGTWGGGIELYWLDVEYRDTKYVIQVPFRYYKELTDEGIIPVKMEVLRIKDPTTSEYLTVISNMSLDEATLNQVLKTQSK